MTSISSKILAISVSFLVFFVLVGGAGSLYFSHTLGVISDTYIQFISAFNDQYSSDAESSKAEVISNLIDEKLDRLSVILGGLERSVEVLSAVTDLHLSELRGSDFKDVEMVDPYEFARLPKFRATLSRDIHFLKPVSFDFPDIQIIDKNLSLLYSALFWKLRPIFRSLFGRPSYALWSYIGFEDDGSVLNFPGNFSEPEGYDPRTRPWYVKAAEAGGKSVWTEPYFDTGNGSLVLTVAKAKYKSSGVGRPIYVAAADVVADRLIGEFVDIQIDPQFLSIVILNDREQVIFRSEDAKLMGNWQRMPTYQTARQFFSSTEYVVFKQNGNVGFSPFYWKNEEFLLFKRSISQTNWRVLFILSSSYLNEFKQKMNVEFGHLADRATLNIQRSKNITTGIFFFLGFALVLLCIGWFAAVRSIIVNPLAKVLFLIKNFSKLKLSSFEEIQAEVSTDEILLLTSELSNLKKSQNLYEQALLKEESLRARTIVAAQVAHDIRSPLTALNIAAGLLTGAADAHSQLIRSATQRINDIANSLLIKAKEAAIELNSAEIEPSKNLTSVALGPLIDAIVFEKQVLYQKYNRLQILADHSRTSEEYARVDPIEFGRILSNLINNSVEALDENMGTVSLDLRSRSDVHILSVKDNGKGMSRDLISKLGQAGITFGKVGAATGSGYGLGISHAKAQVQAWGGGLEIRSELGKGSEVTITLPKVYGVRPPGFNGGALKV